MKKKPFNSLYDVDRNMVFTKNKDAEEIVGLRNIGNAIPIDQPCELDYHCPVCKYKNVIGGNFDERLTWSEYNGFLFCYVCNKDYPSALCSENIDSAISVYLACVKNAIEYHEEKTKP